MKSVAFIFFFLVYSACVAQVGFFQTQNLLHIKKGEVFEITPENKFIITKKWVMEDNSKIVFHKDVSLFVVVADNVEWGNNVIIDGRGKNGKNGKSGVNATSRDRPGDCAHGFSGTSGVSGSKGLDGVNIKLTIGISKLGSMKILANGGKGGSGGNGGNGMSGTKADCSSTCTGGNGGSGGSAGRGGDGGNGGDVFLEYRFLNTGMDVGAILTNINKGQGGKGGTAGRGGAAGRGKGCPFRSYSGGSHGANGASPGSGTPGREGSYKTRLIETR